MSIGEKIYNLRKEKNMSQEDLANVLNVSRQTISKWETGDSNPDFDKIVPLCNFFGISTDSFLKGEDNYYSKKEIREGRKNKALMISLCIIIFIITIILDVIIDEIGGNDPLMVSITLIGMGAIAVILVNYFLAKSVNNFKMPVTNAKKKLINSIINIIILLVYFVISFWFVAWSYSWIIFIVGALIKKIIELIMMLGENDNEE